MICQLKYNVDKASGSLYGTPDRVLQDFTELLRSSSCQQRPRKNAAFTDAERQAIFARAKALMEVQYEVIHYTFR